MDISVKQKVEEYVKKYYRDYKDKNLIIKEADNCYYIYQHENGSPLILGKSIID